jgi:hemerythrin
MTDEPLIVWDKNTFEIGIELIDSQHKVLVGYINELAWAIDNKAERNINSELFRKLYNYTVFHFDAEEGYILSLGKNDNLLHRLQHKHFIEELDRISELNESENISNELLYFLTDWLLHHIQVEDKKFFIQLQNKL